MGKELFVGIDAGTTCLKTGILDGDGGLVARASSEYTLSSPESDWLEEAPADWWDALIKTTREATKSIDVKKISGVCVGGQGPTLVVIDENGRILRPAITWMDTRAKSEHKALSEKVGREIGPSFIPNLMWLRSNEPKAYKKARWFLQSFDYLNYMLTKNVFAAAPKKPFMPWPKELIETVDLDPTKFPQLRLTGDRVGVVCSEASERTGLPEGIPVFAGAADFVCSLIGTGTTKKGRAFDMAGTSEGIILCWDKPLADPDNRMQSFPHPIGDLWMIGGVMSTAGKSLEWFKDNFYASESYEEIITKIEAIPPGADNLVFLPYLTGERSPIWDPRARGVFFGLSLRHTKDHLLRALMESNAYAMRQVYEIIEEVGGKISEIRVCGGQARSDAWNMVKADVWGKRVLVPQVLDAELLGAAIIACWGNKNFRDLGEAAERMVKIQRVIEPNKANYRTYTKLFKLYKKLYIDLKGDFAELSECGPS